MTGSPYNILNQEVNWNNYLLMWFIYLYIFWTGYEPPELKLTSLSYTWKDVKSHWIFTYPMAMMSLFEIQSKTLFHPEIWLIKMMLFELFCSVFIIIFYIFYKKNCTNCLTFSLSFYFIMHKFIQNNSIYPLNRELMGVC